MKPATIHLHRKSRVLELGYADGKQCRLDAEFLRVYSPSAEVRGHHPSQARLESGKQRVAIDRVAAVGNYAVQIYFDDGHHSGIYSWEYLHELCENRERYWQEYLDKLRAAGLDRDPDIQPLAVFDPHDKPGSD